MPSHRTNSPVQQSNPAGNLSRIQSAFIYKGEFHSGPVPPPEVLERFEQLYPGSSKLMIDASIEQGKHRREIEKIFVTANAKNFPRGQKLGFTLGALGIIAGTILVILGHSIIGFSWLVLNIGSLLYAFLHGQKLKSSQPSPSEDNTSN